MNQPGRICMICVIPERYLISSHAQLAVLEGERSQLRALRGTQVLIRLLVKADRVIGFGEISIMQLSSDHE